MPDHSSFDEHPLTQGLHRYRMRHPEESADVAEFLALLEVADREPVFTRSALAGHFTGSAWLVDRSGERVLLTHHRKLDRWLQLGGHADGDEDLSRVAVREAAEESGLRDLALDADIFDIDRHRIPARGDEPEHWHYDVRFVVRCCGSEEWAVSEESLALAWVPVEDLLHAPGFDDSMRRMARKWLGI